MMEYLNNPAMLVLVCEILIFMVIVSITLLVRVIQRDKKTVKSLNALVAEIKTKSEEQKEKMTELLLQPELQDPELIKQSMLELVNGQTQLYKGMIKAIRTQKEEDVVALGDSVNELVDNALRLGRDSGEGCVDKEAQTRLEEDKAGLQESNDDLKDKLDKSVQEMEVLMGEYKRMIGNVQEGEEGSEIEEGSESGEEVKGTDEASLEISDDVVDVTVAEEPEEDSDIGNNQESPDSTIEAEVAEIDLPEEDDIDDIFDGMDDEVMTEASKEEGSTSENTNKDEAA